MIHRRSPSSPCWQRSDPACPGWEGEQRPNLGRTNLCVYWEGRGGAPQHPSNVNVSPQANRGAVHGCCHSTLERGVWGARASSRSQAERLCACGRGGDGVRGRGAGRSTAGQGCQQARACTAWHRERGRG
eukprot:206317-Chlamydomonas_euryale.AAC.2